jgi:hypothetical protein
MLSILLDGSIPTSSTDVYPVQQAPKYTNLEPFLEPFIAESTPKWLSGSS